MYTVTPKRIQIKYLIKLCSTLAFRSRAQSLEIEILRNSHGPVVG